LLKDYPYDSEARVLLLYVLIDEERTADALAEAETLVQQDPGDEVSWSAVADQALKLGRYDRADAAIERLLAIAPDNPNAQYLAGEASFLQARFDPAAAAYAKALKLDPSFGDAELRLARIDALRNQPQAAIARLQRMVGGDFAPSLRVSAAFDLADLARAEGRCTDGLAALDRAHADIVAEQVRAPLELATRARCALDAGDVAHARTLAQQAVTQSPDPPTRYLYVRGLVELAARDDSALLATIGQLRNLPDAPDNHKAHKAADALEGRLRLQQANAGAAVPLLRRAHSAAGYEYDPYALPLGQALEATGDVAGARATLREAAQRGAPGDWRPDLEHDRLEAARQLRRLGV
jgi:tetratricopeptide (TPR) repeat protein